MEIKAILKAVQPVVEKGEFKSRKVWLTVPDEKYPQTVEVECQQAKVDLFDGVAVGAPIIAHCNLRGREWTDPHGVVKVFNSLVCWRVEADKTAYSAQSGAGPLPAADTVLPPEDSLPF